QSRCRIDEISDLNLRDACDPVDKRFDIREFQVQTCLLDLRFGGLDRSLCCRPRLHVVVQLALCNRPFFGQWSVPVHIHFRFAELCLGLCKLCLGLVEQSLKWARIDLKEYLSLAHKRTFFIRLPDNVSRDLRLNLSVDVAIESRNPLAEDWDVFLKNADNFNLGARNGWCRCRTAAPRSHKHGREQTKQNELSFHPEKRAAHFRGRTMG